MLLMGWAAARKLRWSIPACARWPRAWNCCALLLLPSHSCVRTVCGTAGCCFAGLVHGALRSRQRNPGPTY